MNTWMSLLTLPPSPTRSVRAGWSRTGVRAGAATARIVELLGDRRWRTVHEISESIGQERKHVSSNLKRLRDRGEVVSRYSDLPNAWSNPWHPGQNPLVWSLP